MWQFHRQHGGLERIDAEVRSYFAVEVFLFGAVRSQQAGFGCKCGAIGDQQSGILRHTYVLGREETVSHN